MREIALERIADVLVPVFEVVAMVSLTALGVFTERAGITHLESGVDPLTLWFLSVGAVALYAGVYVLGYRTVFPRLRAAFTAR